jgi:hypothetical protein
MYIDLANASSGIMTANGDPTNQEYLARPFRAYIITFRDYDTIFLKFFSKSIF